MNRHRSLLATTVVVLLMATGCSILTPRAPECRADQQLGLVAQSVPTAAYVPCVTALPEGWSATEFDVRSGRTVVGLLSDRAGGRVTEVTLSARCTIRKASPFPARGEGVRSYLAVRGTTPLYEGTLYDVFAGGCVSYDFAFERGEHIELLEDLQQAMRLFPRRELRLELRNRYGVELDT